MKRLLLPIYFLLIITIALCDTTKAQKTSEYTAAANLYQTFQQPPEPAKPWVFWYWMQAAVSREGISADLEVMREAGIGGAYLMPIKGATNPPLINPPVEQLTPEWWAMVKYAMQEANRLGIKLAMGICDGFATAGGPWITPEKSMQKVVWTETYIQGGRTYNDTLTQPETVEGYYRDIAILAFPTPDKANVSSYIIVPKITTSKADVDASFLSVKNNNTSFKSSDSCWIQYAFDEPFTCRSITIRTNGKNYFANRMLVEVSDDGVHFRKLVQLQPPRHGWQDNDADVTHSIPSTAARFFRFVYTNKGAGPGAEDMDAAKWKPGINIKGIELSGAPRIHQYEGKTGEVWRISKRATAQQLPSDLCVSLNKIINITQYYDANGNLNWRVPPGRWTILRIGHTSTGHTNYIGGKGVGLECDKFDPTIVKLQFDNWFGAAFQNTDPELAKEVLKIFHVDSWECGSQNWSSLFQQEFKKRREYDLVPYLPAMAGIPVASADVSERFLHDIRQTIADLVVDNFYGTLNKSAHEKGCSFSAESVAPTMTSDGMMHYKEVDIPMGEFWLRSPTHDKPNDMLDAISGAHIYGKPLVQSEAFTEVHFAWDEYPGMLKALGDRNYALGVNRFVYHVFTHNPWLNKKPGMTLGITGLYFQRDQTWWQPGRAYMEYIQRCQALLQQGRPVADIAVFTGEEVPRRAVLPERLVSALPGIFGDSMVQREAKRLANKGNPLQEMPAGVFSSANISKPQDWIDPLHGYAYDSYNKDALLHYSTIQNGHIQLSGGAEYQLLILPGSRPMNPNANLMSPEVATRLLQLVKNGATLLITERPEQSPGLGNANDKLVQQVAKELWGGVPTIVKNETEKITIWKIGKGRVIKGPYKASSFDILGIVPDVIATNKYNQRAAGIAWTHRTAPDLDIYFISNQQNRQQTITLSLRVAGRLPELWNPITGDTAVASAWRLENGRTILPVRLAPNESTFIILRQPTKKESSNDGQNWITTKTVQTLSGPWRVQFNPEYKGPEQPVVFDTLQDWSKSTNPAIKYYSGTAVYTQTFNWDKTTTSQQHVWLDVGKVANIAEVSVNGIACGVAWTYPYRVDITKAVKQGENNLTIAVTNTWANRLIGDHSLPENKQFTQTIATYILKGKPLLEAGLGGPVTIAVSEK